jgi:transketolase
MSLTDTDLGFLTETAWKIRRSVVQTTLWAGGGHIGGGLSQTDILVILYFHYMNIDPQHPEWEERDRFVLSKGHGGVGYAPVLAEKGYFSAELLKEFNHTGSPFGMHLDRLKVKGLDASTGSLGHGLPIAVGLALGAKLHKKPWRTYCIMGDGELAEGSIWEGAMAASHFKLDNLTGFIDRNRNCIDGCTEEVMALEPIKEKWASFGWNVLEVDGHDFRQLGEAIEEAQATSGKPTVINCLTVKGKGVDYMEGKPEWHYGGLDTVMAEEALKSIDRLYGKA